MIFLVVFLYVEVYGAVALVSESVVQNLLHQFLLLDDVARGVRLDAWREHVERLHCSVIAVGIVLCYLHRLELFEACLLLYLVVTFVSVVLKMAHISDVAYVAHLISEVLEIAEEDVESDGGTCMSEVWVAVNGRSADVHAHVRRMQRLEHFLSSCQGVVYPESLFHSSVYCDVFIVFLY